MRRAIDKVRPWNRAAWVFLLTAVCAPWAWAEPRDVFLHSQHISDQSSPIWIVTNVGADQERRTVVRVRQGFGETNWTQLPDIAAATVGVANQSSELVLMLAGSRQQPDWVWYSAAGGTFRFSYGPQLPDGNRLVAMAGNARDLWALGVPEQSATQPATRESTTMPTTRPVDAGLRLFRMEKGKWQPLAVTWPADLRPLEMQDLSMSIIGGVPHAAVYSGRQQVRIIRAAAEKWVDVAIAPASKMVRFKLLNWGERPALWIVSEQSAGRVWASGKEVALAFAGPVPAPSQMDLTVANDQFRLAFLRDGKLLEQQFNEAGAAVAEPAEPITNRVQTQPSIDWWTMVIMAVLTVFIISSLLRRRNADNEPQE